MGRAPVVMAYHGIADVEPRYDPRRLYVRPDTFRRQVSRLRARGYRFVTMADFAAGLDSAAAIDATCALTFDDGTEDMLTILAPLLAELGVPGTVYVCPGRAGEPYEWCDPASGTRFMTAEELVELARHPHVEVGAHTNEHTNLAIASAQYAYREMASCKARLQDLLGQPVLSFCYPSCTYSPACPDAARRAGYTSAVTCGPRGNLDPFQLKRETVMTPDGMVTFELKSRGLYYALRDTAPVRAARWATRRLRHRREGG